MKIIKISGSSARVGQVMVLIVSIPLIISLLYVIIIKQIPVEGIAIMSIFILVFMLFIRRAFLFADVYCDDEIILIKKLFFKKKEALSNIIEIKEIVFPGAYKIKFKDKSKVLFTAEITNTVKHLVSNEAARKDLEDLKSRLFKGDNTP